MSIERGHAASTAHSAHSSHRPAAAGKATGQAAPPGDFMALMAALEDGPLALDGASLLAGDGALPEPRDPRDPRDLRDARELPGALDPAALLPDRLAAEAAAALAGLAMPPATPAAPVPVPVPVPAGAVLADVAAAAKALVAAGAADPGAPQPLAPAAAPQVTPGTPGTPAAPGTAGMTPVPANPAAAAEFASVFEQLRNHLAAQEAAGPKAGAATGTQPLATAAALVSGREPLRTERGAMASPASWARAEAQAAQAQVQAQIQTVAEAAGAASTGGQGAGAAPDQPGAGVAWAMPDFTPTVHYDATLAAVDAMPAPDAGGMDPQMVEQLRYWVGQGIRSAELTVPGDADPVKVHIALSGNEAQIEFRSEHAGTRDMLAGAVEQLRASLQAQGMVLSGVSVGAHDAGGRQPAGDGAGAEGRPGGRRGGAPAAVAEVAAPAVQRRPAGALDLYV